MPWGVAAVAGASLIGSSMQADAAGDAADAQQQSAAQADATQRYMYDQTRADNAPFLANGTAANNKLALLLGLTPDNSSAPGNYSESRDNFDSAAYLAANPDVANDPGASKDPYLHYIRAGKAEGRAFTPSAAIVSAQNQYEQQTKAAQGEQANGEFGSLLKKFDATDLANDPVYNSGLQFGLDQGTGAINQRALQSGSYDSGATLKALTQYANDYGSTKANDSYNRYNTDQTNVYNRLAGISGSGQTASAQVGAAGTNMANQVSNNQTDAGNARAAGIVGASNAWTSGINNTANAYLKNMSGGTGNSYSSTYDPNYYTGGSAGDSWTSGYDF